MSNQLQTKAETLAQILASNRLTKAASQKITHPSLTSQDSLGKEQTSDIHGYVDGINADTEAAANTNSGSVDNVAGTQNLDASAEQALKADGTTVDTMDPSGNPTGAPQTKSASYYKAQLAGIISSMRKTAAAKQDDSFRTGMEVLQKFASLTSNSTEQDIAEAQDSLVKLASTNPVFGIIKSRILMQKQAEDINALAEAEGISPEEAANELDAAVAANPEMAAELDDEASGEAVAELADAEAATDELMTNIQGMADNASAQLGVEVTPDDIVTAAEETAQLAEEMGVPPEALIQAAVEELQAAGPEISPEDEANAEEVMARGAELGLSPEEVIQVATEIANEEGDVAPAEEAPVEKAASLQKRAARTERAAYVQYLRNNR